MRRFNLIVSVTSACSLRCEHCGQGEWRKAFTKPYHASEQQIRDLVQAIEKSAYLVNELSISGGEPTMWKKPSLIKILADCKKIRRIKILTNGTRRIPGSFIKYADWLVVSLYSQSNEKVIEQIKKAQADGLIKVKFKHKQMFWEWPRKIHDGLTNGCWCRALHWINGRIQSCPQLAEICTRFDMTPGDSDTPCLPDFYDSLTDFEYGREIYCRFCPWNGTVQKTLPKVSSCI